LDARRSHRRLGWVLNALATSFGAQFWFVHAPPATKRSAPTPFPQPPDVGSLLT